MDGMMGMFDKIRERVRAKGTADRSSLVRSYQCDVCQDHGVVVTRPDGISVLAVCECQPPVTPEVVQARLGIPKGLRDATFTSFNPRPSLTEVDQLDLKELVLAAKAFSMGQAEEVWFTMSGTKGWGKTHLAYAILNGRIFNPEWGRIGRCATGPSILAELRAGYDDGSYEDVMESFQSTPLLILDDLGAEYQKASRDGAASWADEQLHRILDHRYVEEMETVITTNVHDSKLNPRIRDRMMDEGTGLCRVFDLALPSYRSGKVVTV